MQQARDHHLDRTAAGAAEPIAQDCAAVIVPGGFARHAADHHVPALAGFPVAQAGDNAAAARPGPRALRQRKSNAGKAETLGVGRLTVRNAICRVLDKLGVDCQAEFRGAGRAERPAGRVGGTGGGWSGELSLAQRHPNCEDQAPVSVARLFG